MIHRQDGASEFRADGNGDDLPDHSGSSFVSVLQSSVDSINNNGGHIKIALDGPEQKVWDGTLNLAGKADGLTLSGKGYRSTYLTVQDSLNQDAIVWDGNNTSSRDFGFSARDWVLNGNKSNNTSGSGLVVKNTTGSIGLRDVFMTRFFIDSFQDDGISTADTWGWKLDSMYVERCNGTGVVGKGQGSNFKAVNCKFLDNGGVGNVQIKTGDARFVACSFGGGGDDGILVQGGRAVLSACEANNNTNKDVNLRANECGVRGGSYAEINVAGNDCHVDPDEINTATIESGAADNRVRLENSTTLTDNGTRTRINGVAQEALGGSAPSSPSNWDTGDVVEDTDNSGDAYVKLPSSGFSQIAT